MAQLKCGECGYTCCESKRCPQCRMGWMEPELPTAPVESSGGGGLPPLEEMRTLPGPVETNYSVGYARGQREMYAAIRAALAAHPAPPDERLRLVREAVVKERARIRRIVEDYPNKRDDYNGGKLNVLEWLLDKIDALASHAAPTEPTCTCKRGMHGRRIMDRECPVHFSEPKRPTGEGENSE